MLTPPRPTSLLEPKESGRHEPNVDSFLGFHLPPLTPSIFLTQNVQNFMMYEKAGGHQCISYNEIDLVSINEEDRIANLTEAILQLHLGPAWTGSADEDKGRGHTSAKRLYVLMQSQRMSQRPWACLLVMPQTWGGGAGRLMAPHGLVGPPVSVPASMAVEGEGPGKTRQCCSRLCT